MTGSRRRGRRLRPPGHSVTVNGRPRTQSRRRTQSDNLRPTVTVTVTSPCIGETGRRGCRLALRRKARPGPRPKAAPIDPSPTAGTSGKPRPGFQLVISHLSLQNPLSACDHVMISLRRRISGYRQHVRYLVIADRTLFYFDVF